jgi:hypothetical protein
VLAVRKIFRIRSFQLEVNVTDEIHCRLCSQDSLFEENPNDRINGLEHGADAVFVAGDAGAVEILKQRDGVFTGQAS